jgi:hypothetical protein
LPTFHWVVGPIIRKNGKEIEEIEEIETINLRKTLFQE